MTKNEEILLILQEECAEVIQAVSKIKRFGAENNQTQLEQEIADVLCMINLCATHGIISSDHEHLENLIKKKEMRLREFSSIFN